MSGHPGSGFILPTCPYPAADSRVRAVLLRRLWVGFTAVAYNFNLLSGNPGPGPEVYAPSLTVILYDGVYESPVITPPDSGPGNLSVAGYAIPFLPLTGRPNTAAARLTANFTDPSLTSSSAPVYYEFSKQTSVVVNGNITGGHAVLSLGEGSNTAGMGIAFDHIYLDPCLGTIVPEC